MPLGRCYGRKQVMAESSTASGRVKDGLGMVRSRASFETRSIGAAAGFSGGGQNIRLKTVRCTRSSGTNSKDWWHLAWSRDDHHALLPRWRNGWRRNAAKALILKTWRKAGTKCPVLRLTALKQATELCRGQIARGRKHTRRKGFVDDLVDRYPVDTRIVPRADRDFSWEYPRRIQARTIVLSVSTREFARQFSPEASVSLITRVGWLRKKASSPPIGDHLAGGGTMKESSRLA